MTKRRLVVTEYVSPMRTYYFVHPASRPVRRLLDPHFATRDEAQAYIDAGDNRDGRRLDIRVLENLQIGEA